MAKSLRGFVIALTLHSTARRVGTTFPSRTCHPPETHLTVADPTRCCGLDTETANSVPVATHPHPSLITTCANSAPDMQILHEHGKSHPLGEGIHLHRHDVLELLFSCQRARSVPPALTPYSTIPSRNVLRPCTGIVKYTFLPR